MSRLRPWCYIVVMTPQETHSLLRFLEGDHGHSCSYGRGCKSEHMLDVKEVERRLRARVFPKGGSDAAHDV